MAQEIIPTAIQEEISIDYFDLIISNNFDVSDSKYRKLLLDTWGETGKFPPDRFPNMNTEKGRHERLVWIDSFDKQIGGLAQFFISRGWRKFSGWKWSRGDGMMGFLNDIARQRCGVRQLDSWNPMDIVAVQASMEKVIKDEIDSFILPDVDNATNKDLLNGIMIKYIKGMALLPISLKKVAENERGAFEESDNLKSESAKRKHHLDLTFAGFKCDLEWSTVKNEWENAQEISFNMEQKPTVTTAGVFISVQARAGRAVAPREKPQHSLSQRGAGAMLGKAPIDELEKFVKEYGVIPPHAPKDNPMIPKVGKKWTQNQKDYWIGLQKKLAAVTIGGKKIDFGTPGSYGQNGLNTRWKKDAKGKNTKTKLTGFALALESACAADELGLTTTPGGRESGSRLTAKLWGMEWLARYYEMSKRGVWEPFAIRMMKAAKKELSDSGPFIKILGEQGRTAAQKQLRVQKLIAEDPDKIPIYDPKLKNKKTGEIPVNKMIPKNIVGFKSKDPFYNKFFGYEE